jgi:ubiquinone/menaquinone biosynthesis C-methylase UbiE
MPKIQEFVQLNGKEVLEIGCGNGRISRLLADRVKSLIAIDPDEEQIALAPERVSGVDFRVGTGESLGFNDESFDIVLFSYSLHHQDFVKALNEANRVLRKEGQLLVIEPAQDGEYTQYVSIFEEDEISRIKKTLAYIKSGSFDIMRKGAYFVSYSFANDCEVYNHFLGCFGGERTESNIEKMKVLLGGEGISKPIIVRDKVNIFLLGVRRLNGHYLENCDP